MTEAMLDQFLIHGGKGLAAAELAGEGFEARKVPGPLLRRLARLLLASFALLAAGLALYTLLYFEGDGATVEDAVDFLIRRAERYASSINGTESRFVKQPATWLNKGSFDDELAGSESIYKEFSVP